MKRSTEGLREVLFTELEDFLAGNVSTEHVKAVCLVSKTILHTTTTELEAAKLRGN